MFPAADGLYRIRSCDRGRRLADRLTDGFRLISSVVAERREGMKRMVPFFSSSPSAEWLCRTVCSGFLQFVLGLFLLPAEKKKKAK